MTDFKNIRFFKTSFVILIRFNTTTMKYLPLIISALIITSCNPLNQRFKDKNALSLVQNVQESITDTLQLNFLNFLQNEITNRTDYYYMLTDQGLTLGQILIQVDSLNVIEDSYNDDFKLLFSEIDDFCTEYQHQIEDFLLVKERINQFASVKLLALRSTKWDYYEDVIELKVKVRNHMSKVLKSARCFISLQGKNGIEANIPVKFELPVSGSYDFHFIYDEKAHSNEYQQLNQLVDNIESFSYQFTYTNYSDTSINLSDFKVGELFKNNHYLSNRPSIDTPSEFCPYIESSAPLIRDVNILFSRKQDEIHRKLPLMYKFWMHNKSNNSY